MKLALSYLNIPYNLQEWEEVDKSMLALYSPQVTAPILLDGDFSIWDSSAIMSHLSELQNVNKTILPGAIKQRTKARQLEIYSSSFVGKALRDIIQEKRDIPESQWNLDKIAQGEQAWDTTLEWLEQAFEGEHSFLKAGFSLAECALLLRFMMAEHYGVGIPERFPKLYRWFQYWRSQSLIRETTPWI